MHRKERHVETDQQHPEVEPAEPLAEQPTGHLRVPVVDAADQREHGPANQYVVEVSDDKERVVHLCVERDDGEHHARQAADDESDEEADHEQQWRCEPGSAPPQRRNPAENLHACRDQMTMLAAVKYASPSCGNPVANM